MFGASRGSLVLAMKSLGGKNAEKKIVRETNRLKDIDTLQVAVIDKLSRRPPRFYVALLHLERSTEQMFIIKIQKININTPDIPRPLRMERRSQPHRLLGIHVVLQRTHLLRDLHPRRRHLHPHGQHPALVQRHTSQFCREHPLLRLRLLPFNPVHNAQRR
jgi:hypothetical protein